jgi:hypothetical protein
VQRRGRPLGIAAALEAAGMTPQIVQRTGYNDVFDLADELQ